MQISVTLSALGLAALAASPNIAQAADVVPGTTYYTSYLVHNDASGGYTAIDVLGPGTSKGTYCNNGQCGSGWSSADDLEVSAGGQTAQAHYGYYTSVSMTRQYYRVDGPLNIPVPLVITGHGIADASGAAFADAQIGWGAVYGGSLGHFDVCAGFACGNSHQDKYLRQSYTAIANSLQTDYITAFGQTSDIGLNYYATGIGSYFAWTDPVIAIDPTFAAEHPEYSLEFSASSVVAAVPEPATYVTMMVGMGLIGAMVRRRRPGNA